MKNDMGVSQILRPINTTFDLGSFKNENKNGR